MEADKIKLNTVILAVLIVGSIEIVSRFLIGRGLLAPLAGVGLARLFAIVLLLILIRKGEKRLSAIGLQVAGTFQGFKKGLIWAISFGAAAGLALVVLYFFDVGTQGLFQMPLPQAGSKLILFFVVGAVIGPLAEEIFFRGILYGFLRRWGVFFAVAMSTLLFVLPPSHMKSKKIFWFRSPFMCLAIWPFLPLRSYSESINRLSLLSVIRSTLYSVKR
jgi:membrane protease YdiL (CAAX protease family)